MAGRPLQIRMDQDFKERVKMAAAKQGSTASEVVRNFLQEYLAKNSAA